MSAESGTGRRVLEDLHRWWRATSDADFSMVAPKSVEYGSVELVEMGQALARIRGREVDEAEAIELACWFYALGKMQRWTAAVTRGDRVSVDTLTDLGVYAMMTRHARGVGSWPGAAPDGGVEPD